MSALPDISALEDAAGEADGVAQALHGLSSADPGEKIDMALMLLARAAGRVHVAIVAHVEAHAEARRLATQAGRADR